MHGKKDVLHILLNILADAEIPDDPDVALRENVMKTIRTDAVKQVDQMLDLLDSIAATTIKNSIVGETFTTKSKGIRMVMNKYVRSLQRL